MGNRSLGGLGLVRFEGDLEDAVAESVAVERLDGDHCLVVVGHRDEAKALTLVRLQVSDDFDALDGPEGSEELPEHVLLRLRGQIVDEDAPARPVHCVSWNDCVGQQVTCQR